MNRDRPSAPLPLVLAALAAVLTLLPANAESRERDWIRVELSDDRAVRDVVRDVLRDVRRNVRREGREARHFGRRPSSRYGDRLADRIEARIRDRVRHRIRDRIRHSVTIRHDATEIRDSIRRLRREIRELETRLESEGWR